MKPGQHAKFFELGEAHRWDKNNANGDSKPVAIHDCEVKPARQSQDLMKSSARIESSPRKFDVNIENITDNEITLDHPTTNNDFDRISVVAKVTRIRTIANSTGTVKLTLWEADIWKVTEDTTYRFSSMMLRSYQEFVASSSKAPACQYLV